VVLHLATILFCAGPTQVPARSRFFQVFVEENQKKINLAKRRVKVRLAYFDDPRYQKERRKEKRRRARANGKNLDDASLGEASSISTLSRPRDFASLGKRQSF